jgi:uncharacterized protein
MKLQETNVPPQGSNQSEEDRVSRYDWRRIDSELGDYGGAVLEKLLTPKECNLIAALYSKEEHFRSHIIMARHGFGKGEYRYFKYPLPKLIGDLRTALYSRLAPIANQWNERMGEERRYPPEHADFLKRCHDCVQPHCYCNMCPATTTACIKTCMATWPSPSKSRSYSLNRARISLEASSF